MSTATPRAYHPNLATALVYAAAVVMLNRTWIGMLHEAVPTMGLAAAALSVGATGGSLWPTARGRQIRLAPEPPHDHTSLGRLALDALWMSVRVGAVFFAVELVLWVLGANPQPVHFNDEHAGTAEHVYGAFVIACAFTTGAIIGCETVQSVMHARWRRARGRVPDPAED